MTISPPPTLSEEDRLRIGRQLMSALPFSRALGMTIEEMGEGLAVISMPFNKALIGDPETGVIHGGAVSALMDTCGGAAVLAAENGPTGTATLDLRIDYMRPAESGRDILAEAECYHVTKSVAFCRAWAYHETREKVIAAAQGAFAINKPRTNYKKGDQM